MVRAHLRTVVPLACQQASACARLSVAEALMGLRHLAGQLTCERAAVPTPSPHETPREAAATLGSAPVLALHQALLLPAWRQLARRTLLPRGCRSSRAPADLCLLGRAAQPLALASRPARGSAKL